MLAGDARRRRRCSPPARQPAGAAFVAAFAIKAPAAIAAPFALLGSRATDAPDGTSRSSSLDRPGAAGLFLGGWRSLRWRSASAAYAAFGWHWLDALELAGENQGQASHLSIPTTFARLTGLDPTAVRAAALALYAALVIYLLVWTWRGGDWLRAPPGPPSASS